MSFLFSIARSIVCLFIPRLCGPTITDAPTMSPTMSPTGACPAKDLTGDCSEGQYKATLTYDISGCLPGEDDILLYIVSESKNFPMTPTSGKPFVVRSCDPPANIEDSFCLPPPDDTAFVVYGNICKSGLNGKTIESGEAGLTITIEGTTQTQACSTSNTGSKQEFACFYTVPS